MAIKVALTITDGPNKGESFELSEGTTLIGRKKGEIILDDKKVSSAHCEIIVDGNQCWLEDLQSTNGTFLGGRKVEEKLPLNNLDTLTVGLTSFSVAIVESLDDFREANASPTTGAPPPPPPVDTPEPELEVEPSFEELEPIEDSLAPAAEFIPMAEDAATSTPEPQDAPAPEPGFESDGMRQTGVDRIDNLINEELESFSKWDYPQNEEADSEKAIPKVRVKLIFRKGPEGVGDVVCSHAVTTIGRKGVDVRVNDLDLSRKHFSIEIVGGTSVFARDHASTNGTYINGQKIDFKELQNGDLMQVGQTIFEVEIERAD